MSSLTPPPVPMELHAVNRRKLCDSLRRHLSSSDRPLDGLVLLQVLFLESRYEWSISNAYRWIMISIVFLLVCLLAVREAKRKLVTALITPSSSGTDLRIFFKTKSYCADNDGLCRQESYFAYLFGVKEPDFYGAIVSFPANFFFQSLLNQWINFDPLFFLVLEGHWKWEIYPFYSKVAWGLCCMVRGDKAIVSL